MALRHYATAPTAGVVVTKKKGGIIGGANVFAAAAATKLLIHDCAATADATAANVIATIGIDITATADGTNVSKNWNPTEPVKYNDGLVLILTGAASTASIYYK